MSGSFWHALVFALSVTLPSILLLVLGWFLRRSGQIDERFCDQASKIVFRYSLPALLFFSIYGNKVNFSSQIRLIAAGAVASLILFVGAEFIAARMRLPTTDKGVFVQGVYRSNTMVAGLAFIANAYGAEGVAVGAVFGGAMTLLYNVLAVVTLNQNTAGSRRAQLIHFARHLSTNPLILGIVLALLAKAINLPVSPLLVQTGGYLAAIALPLALICAGATLNVQALFKVSDIAIGASLGRLIASPIIAILMGLAFGLNGLSMGVLFMMMATPVAAASYVMAKAMGANEIAAANIIGITTVGAMPIAAAGIAILRSLGWI